MLRAGFAVTGLGARRTAQDFVQVIVNGFTTHRPTWRPRLARRASGTTVARWHFALPTVTSAGNFRRMNREYRCMLRERN